MKLEKFKDNQMYQGIMMGMAVASAISFCELSIRENLIGQICFGIGFIVSYVVFFTLDMKNWKYVKNLDALSQKGVKER